LDPKLAHIIKGLLERRLGIPQSPPFFSSAILIEELPGTKNSPSLVIMMRKYLLEEVTSI
jgi:hypothetical protein